ncbi:hypothetical protein QBC36DRAFT_336445 [Triangularia setosa]|uniref:SUN domain-containing protein n=1 Tax=Triangularia setosa TaxID=2587417 RepID=A0AAN6W1E7_9PEZI|nr:hypothetical protein QBC36DRAFT_336445 [Podospora setosa]
MTDALSSPATSLHISLNLSQSSLSRDTSPFKLLDHSYNSASLFTMPPRQRPGRGGKPPTPSPQQQGRAGTPSSVRSTRKPVDAGSVRVDIPVKYSTSYGSSMATLPDRVRIMGGGNVRNAVHGVLEQVTKDNEAAKARQQAKEQDRAYRTKTSSPHPQLPVQPPPPVQQPQTVGRTRAPVKTTLSQQISRSGSEESEEQGEVEEDGPSQQTLVESQHGATTSTRADLLSRNKSRSHSRSRSASTPGVDRPANALDDLMAGLSPSPPAQPPPAQSRKRSRDPDSPEITSPEMAEMRRRLEALRESNGNRAAERADVQKARHEELERKGREELQKTRREEREKRRQEALQAAQAWASRDQAEQTRLAGNNPVPVSRVANRDQSVSYPVPPASNSVPRPPGFSLHQLSNVSVPRPPSVSVSQPVSTRLDGPVPRLPEFSNAGGAQRYVGDGNARSWQEEIIIYPRNDGAASGGRGVSHLVSSPSVGHIAAQPPTSSLEDALGTIERRNRSSVGGRGRGNSDDLDMENIRRNDLVAGRGVRPSVPAPAVPPERVRNDGGGAIGGVGGFRVPPNKPLGPVRRNSGSSDSSSSSEDENVGGTANHGARHAGQPDNRRTARGGANRNTDATYISRARKVLGKIWWPTLQWVLVASMLIGILSVLSGPSGPSVLSFPSFSLGSLSGPTVVFTEEQYADFKRFWETRSIAAEVALRSVQSTLPKVVRVTKDKNGNIIVAKEFWEAILDRVKHEPSILKLKNGKISEDHWDAIRSRIKSAGLDQSFEDWFEKNKHRISSLFSGHPITKPVTSERETYHDTVTRDQYVENLKQQVSKSRQDFERELEGLRKELHGLIEEQRHKTGGLSKKEVQKLVKDIVDKELGSSVLRPGKNSPVAAVNDMLSRHVNWFSFGNGAQIDVSITSPTYRLDRPAMGTVAWFKTMTKKPQFLHDSFHATSLWTDSGHCWCAGIFAGKNKEKLPADIGISVAGLIIPKYVVVENINPGATTDPGSMPEDIEVWAKFENKVKNAQMQKWMNTHFPDAAENPRNAGQLREDFVQIGKFTYEYHLIDNGVFIHKLSDDLVALDAVVETVLIRAVTNNGSQDHTCFYRLRLYGQEIDEQTGKHIGPSSW